MTAGVLLAAGASRRMGAEASKLLLPASAEGEPLVRVCARILLQAGLAPVVAVLGSRSEEVARALTGLPVECITNPRHALGMGTSLAAGIAALPAAATRAVVALGDMPGVRAATVRALLGSAEGKGVIVPVYRGQRGHPVVFALARYRAALEGLAGDRGARGILEAHPGDVAEIAVGDPGVLLDLDTREEYAAWRHVRPTEPREEPPCRPHRP